MKPKIIIAFILLLVIVFISVIPRKKFEYFDSLDPNSAFGGESTQSLYYNARSTDSFDNAVSQNFNGLVDYTSSMLLMKRCYAIPEVLIEELEREDDAGFYTNYFSIYTNDFKDVQQKLLDHLIQFADRQSTKLIKGDVYILLTQQPYYRHEDGTEISLDATKINERHNYFGPKYSGKAVIDEHPIYYSGIIIFAAYNSDGSYVSCKDAFYNLMKDWDKTLVSNQNQCFIRCVNDESKFCGCATGTETGASEANKRAAISANTTPYDSMCLGKNLSNPSDTTKITPTSYYILYIVNQQYKIDFDMSRIFDRTDSCKLVNNMPPTDPNLRARMNYTIY